MSGSTDEQMIFDELDELVPIGERAEERNNVFRPTIQHPKLSVVRDDAAFEIITNALTAPSQLNDEEDSTIKRSYQVMKYICDDLEEAEEMLKSKLGKDDDDLYLKYLLNPTRAGLLAKKIFAAYRHLNKVYDENLFEVPKAHIPHLNKALEAMLDAFPTQVVGATCVGGEKGVEQSLGQMLQLHSHVSSEHSAISIVEKIINIGCTGKEKETATLQQQQAAMMGGGGAVDKVLINHSHRRKFVRGLTQWGGFENFVNLVNHDMTCADIVTDSLLSIVECISFPKPSLALNLNGINGNKTKNTKEESVGEEALLTKLASDEIIETLFECITTKSDKIAQSDIDAVSNALLGLFELATGKGRQDTAPSLLSSGDDESVECKASESSKATTPGIHDNKMVKSGVTDKLHAAITSKMSSLIGAMDIYMNSCADEGIKEQETEFASVGTAVRHPGRYVIEKPFTSNRLQLFTLFTDLVSYESHCDLKDEHGKYDCALKALDTVMELPLLSAITEDNDEIELEVVYNPWPGICDLLFNYPENNMFQFQFYRLIHALCATNHDKTLKLVVQKCKFLSRAIKACSTKAAPTSTRGILLRCLNALRLHSQSISSHSFLRHYLESHDGWKDFQDELTR